MTEAARVVRQVRLTMVAALVVVLLVLVPTWAAQAAWGNKIVNSSNRCTTFVWEGASYRTTMCGLNNYAHSVDRVIVKANTCLDIGDWWTFRRYCAPWHDLNVYVEGGTHYIR